MKEKIIFDCERMKHHHTGLYYYCYYLGKNLLNYSSDEREVCYYIPSSSDGVFGKDICYHRQHGMHKTFLPLPRKTRLWHSTYQGTNYFPNKKNLKIVLTVHDLNFMYDQSKRDLKKNRYLQKLLDKVERADAIVTISRYVLEDLRQYVNLDDKETSVIYNGCTIEDLAELSDPVTRPSKAFLFTIGTIVDKKNFHVLPALLRNNDLQLIIAGITQNEDYKQKIIEEAKRFNVDDRVLFVGAINENDRQWYYKNCEAFVFPSISEGFGLPVIEAMHFGKQVLLSKATSLPEVGGDLAYYFESFDPDAMSKTLETALNHSEHSSEDIAAWSQNFDWKIAAGQYFKLYESLLTGNKVSS